MRIFNMDCSEMMRSEEYRKLTEGKKVIIVTDPPFNIGYHYQSYDDRMREDEYYGFLRKTFEGKPLVCVHYPEALHRLSAAIGRFPERVVSWVYNSNTAKQHRDIAFYGIKPDFTKVKQPYKNPTDKRIQKRIAEGKGARLYDWWEINQVKNVSKSRGGAQTPLRDAHRGDDEGDRGAPRGCDHSGSVHGERDDRHSMHEARKRLHRVRDRRRILR